MDSSVPRKRPASPRLISNPFIKKKNLKWTLDAPDNDCQGPLLWNATASGGVSETPDPSSSAPEPRPTAAAVESGAAVIDDHLTEFSAHLAQFVTRRPEEYSIPRLSIDEYAALYLANAGSEQGAHFVIHQHDHPIAGTHYDLRLQINETSSASWAIMYGLPGDPNSMRLNRNATETRIHSLWNHLIETASPDTGSLMIWDTGTYSILPRRSKHAPALDPNSGPSDDETASSLSPPTATQQSLLHAAFQSRKIKIRLHGTKLPDPYVIYMRLTKTEDAAGRAKATRTKKPTRRRRRTGKSAETKELETSASESNGGEDSDADIVPATNSQLTQQDAAAVSALETELRELEDNEVRRTNAYKGAKNSIGSIHQRKWYLSLERDLSGFLPTKSESHRKTWQPKGNATGETAGLRGFDIGNRLSYPFYIRGRDTERSVVTGRLGADILRDEGVDGFLPRKGWKPVIN